MTPNRTTTPEWLARRAHLTPDTPALIAGDDEWSFAELDGAAQHCVDRLTAIGVGDRPGAETTPMGPNTPGPRVAILMPNTPAFIAWVHALPKAGAILVPLNTRLTPAELTWQLQDVGASTLIYHEAFAETVHQITAAISTLHLIDGTELPRPVRHYPEIVTKAPGAQHHPAEIELDAIHSIVYTSGTTGHPKGAILTYGNHWWSAIASALNLGLSQNDRWLACMPLFHVGGLAILLRSVIYGIPIVLHERFDPAAVDHELATGGATIVSLVATMLERTLEAHEADDGAGYPPTLRAILLGGGPAPEALLHHAATLRAPVLQTYGLTEAASQVATLAPGDAIRKLGSAGKPLFPTSVRIVDLPNEGDPGAQCTRDVHEGAESHQIGEILVSGPTITPGYWNRPDETAEALRDGWLHTGDLGYLDDDGYLYVVDRRSDLFISGGENVYPAEIEAILRAHPAVIDAGVVGLDDEVWGRVPAAAIVVSDSESGGGEGGPELISGLQKELEAELDALCEAHLARYKVPRTYTIFPELPRNAAGKLQRHLLYDYLSKIVSSPASR